MVGDDDEMIENYDPVSIANTPPEILISNHSEEVSVQCSEAIDMWALGCIMFQMLTGYHPFEEDCRIAVLFRIFKTLGTPS